MRLRDSPDFPARKYLLGHVARELRNRIHEYLGAWASSPESSPAKPGRVKITASFAKRWVAEIAPDIDSFGADKKPTVENVTIPVGMAIELNKVMRYEAYVSEALLGRIVAGLRPLQRVVALETLTAAAEGLHKTDGTPYAHLRAPGKDFAESEVLTLWDELEGLLFDLVGSAAWAYETVDQTIQELNEL